MNAPVKAQPQGPVRLGRPAAARRAAHRRRAHGARRRAAYCQEKLAPRVLEAFRHEKTDPAIFREMGELGLLGPTIPEQYGGAGLNYVSLRPDRARGRARRLRLPLDDERADLAGDGADQRVRHRGAEAEVPAEARHRRVDRLLRPDRAEPRLRPRQHDHAREEGAGRLQLDRRQDVDHQLADRRRVRGLGQGRRGRRSAASSSKRARRACPRRRSTARSACAPPSPARS